MFLIFGSENLQGLNEKFGDKTAADWNKHICSLQTELRVLVNFVFIYDIDLYCTTAAHSQKAHSHREKAKMFFDPFSFHSFFK